MVVTQVESHRCLHRGSCAATPSRPRRSSGSCSSASPTSSATPKRSTSLETVACYPADPGEPGARQAGARLGAGCSTGEEAFSLAILLREHGRATSDGTSRSRSSPPTSTPRRSNGRAPGRIRRASPPTSSPERLARFFTQEGDGYRVRKTIRDMVVFARAGRDQGPAVLAPRPVSCRNLLIYLDGDLQRWLMPLFHYALDEGGYLFLGSSEIAPLRRATAFAVVDKKWKLYRRLAGAVAHAAGPHSTSPDPLVAPLAGFGSRGRGGAPLGARASGGARAARAVHAGRGHRQRRGQRAVLPRPDRQLPRAGRRRGRAPTSWTWPARACKHELAAGLRKALTSEDPVPLREAPRQDERGLRPRRSDRRAGQTSRTSPRASSSCSSRRSRRPQPEVDDRQGHAGNTMQRIADLERELSSKEEYLQHHGRGARDRPTKSSSRPTRSCSRPTRSCSRPTKSSRPPRKSCSRSTRS